MKKTIAIISSLSILLACLVTGAAAISGTYNNYDNPRKITLPASEGCGDNKIGLYVDHLVTLHSVSQKAKYKWYLLTGTYDVLHCCNAVKIEATQKMLVDTVGILTFQKSGTFYGNDMTTSQYHTITDNQQSFNENIEYVKLTHTTTVKNPFDQHVIVSDTFIKPYE